MFRVIVSESPVAQMMYVPWPASLAGMIRVKVAAFPLTAEL